MKTIAIVEDSLVVRKLLSTILKSAGYRVIECANEEEAKRLGHVDMAVLDYLLPDGNGLNVAKFLKRKNPAVSLVLLTARRERVSPQEAQEYGIEFYLQKPINPEKILEIAKERLSS